MKTAFPLAVVVVVPLLLYARTADFDFVHADDADLIGRNQGFLSDVRNAPRAFSRSYFEIEGEADAQKTYYRPIAIVSFMADAARSGVSPRSYHITNNVLHAIAAGLLFALAVSWGAPQWAAVIAALLFAVHPLTVQAVAWIAGRNELLVAVFGLVSMLSFGALKRYATVAQPFTAAIHVVSFGLALFSKETGLFFPVIAVLHQRLVFRTRMTRLQWIALACDGALVAAWVALRRRALSGMPAELSVEALRTAFVSLPQLLVHAGKMLFPIRLNVSPSIDGPGMTLGAIAVIALAWSASRLWDRGTAMLAASWALLFLLPTLAVPGLPVYEHRAYVPLIAIVVCGAAVLAGMRQVVALAIVIAIFTALTYQRLNVFRDAFAYWTDATRDAQFGPIAHVNLGQLHEAAGRPADARREYLRALERDPNTPKAHNNLGVVLMQLDEPELALKHFKEETMRHPWNADAWFNLGVWNETRGDRGSARRFYERATALGHAPPTPGPDAPPRPPSPDR